MKHIGLVGGLSPESTVDYYKIICSKFNEMYGGVNFPQLTIRSINLQEMMELFNKNEWEKAADKIVAAIHDLQGAGADFAAITANTPHNAYDIFASRAPLPVISIMETTADAIRRDGNSRVGLLGTKMTMEYGFFQKTFDRYGIETIVPEKADRDYVNDTIWNELTHGVVKPETSARYAGIVEWLVESGVEGIILGCTELPLVIKPGASPVKTYNTAEIHALEILNYSIRD